MFRKVVEWVLGGFGSLLLAASIVCFIAWYVQAICMYIFGLTIVQETARRAKPTGVKPCPRRRSPYRTIPSGRFQCMAGFLDITRHVIN